MPYATYRFNKIIAAETIRFIVTVAIVVYKGLKLVVYRMLTVVPEKELQNILTRLAELRKSGQEQRQSFGEVKNYVVATFGCLKEMLETMKRVP